MEAHGSFPEVVANDGAHVTGSKSEIETDVLMLHQSVELQPSSIQSHALAEGRGKEDERFSTESLRRKRLFVLTLSLTLSLTPPTTCRWENGSTQELQERADMAGSGSPRGPRGLRAKRESGGRANLSARTRRRIHGGSQPRQLTQPRGWTPDANNH